MTTILIGIDDTDNATSRGTGYLARCLSEECRKRGLSELGVTRHQFLVDSRIPFTSHNSGACVAVAAQAGPEAVSFAFDFVAARVAEGSDPGVCIAPAECIPPAIIAFGQRATAEIVEMAEAFDLAKSAGLALRDLGGTGLGVIGALSSVGLRAEGNEGRFIDWPGLRELPEQVSGERLAGLGVRVESRSVNRDVRPADVIETGGWARPRLIGGRPVLWVEWSEEQHVWITVDRKKN